MQNSFYNELNKNTIDALNTGKAFFTKQGEIQMPIINNSFTGNPITGANYLNLKLSNDLNDTRHTEYVKMNDALNSRPEWLSGIPRENRPRGTLYQEEEITSNPRYSFVMPTAELNQNVFQDNPEYSRSRRNYVPFQSNNTRMGNFDEFVQEQLTNAVNASFTGTPYRNNIKENESDHFKAMLIESITKNPDFLAKVANKAYQNVIDNHYVPFDRKSFIERARNENSYEFNQLNSAIAEHIEDMYSSKKPSFNREFNELAQPLIIKIENLHIDKLDNFNKKTIIGNETTDFVKEKIKEDKPASVMAETFVGTAIEKAAKIINVGKKVLVGVAIAVSLINPELSAGITLACTLFNLDTSNVNKDKPDPKVSNTKDSPQFTDEHFEKGKIVINDRTFQGKELYKILNFDNEPFSMTGNRYHTGRDFEIAHRAEKSILGMIPNVNKDEYQKEMVNIQMSQFIERVTERIPEKQNLSSSTILNNVMKVADTITAMQELKGDTMLRSFRNNNDSRSLFAGLNMTIRNNPQILDQAISQINQNQNHQVHSGTHSRK
jgi:hypothetical protein